MGAKVGSRASGLASPGGNPLTHPPRAGGPRLMTEGTK